MPTTSVPPVCPHHRLPKSCQWCRRRKRRGNHIPDPPAGPYDDIILALRFAPTVRVPAFKVIADSPRLQMYELYYAAAAQCVLIKIEDQTRGDLSNGDFVVTYLGMDEDALFKQEMLRPLAHREGYLKRKAAEFERMLIDDLTS